MNKNPEFKLLLWIVSFLFGWAVYLQTAIIFPSVTGTAFLALRGGIFSIILISFIMILVNFIKILSGDI